jgi:hypothetical protein
MVKIIGFQQRQTVAGKVFFVLELEGGLQILPSITTGSLYASKSKCTVPCPFSEKEVKELIGTTLPGSIERVPCEPYSFKNPEGKNVELDYRYTYKQPGTASNGATPTLREEIEVEVN